MHNPPTKKNGAHSVKQEIPNFEDISVKMSSNKLCYTNL